MGVVKKRRFYVTDVVLNRREVFPVNFNGKYTHDRKLNEGQWFYRTKYGSKVDFIDGDYQYFNEIEYDPATRCQQLIFEVEVLCGQTWNTEWKGVFSTGQGIWDKDNCRFSVSIDPYDDYNCLLDNFALDFNLLDNENTITSEVTIQGDYEFYSCRSNVPIEGTEYTDCITSRPEPPESWKEFYYNYEPFAPAPPFDYVRVWIREVAVTSCVGSNPQIPTGDGWILIDDNCGVDGTATYVRQPLTSWTSVFNPEVAWGECPDLEPPSPVFKTTQCVSGSTAGVRSDILGADFIDATIISSTIRFYLNTPSTSVNSWAVENDGDSIVTSTSNPTQYIFEVDYVCPSLGAPFTFDIVCREATDCGDIIEHRKVVTARANSSTPTGNNVLYVDGVTYLCPDQDEQTYTIPIEYRGQISSVLWTVNALYSTILSQSTYSITIKPTGASSGASPINIITAVANYLDGSQTTSQVSGYVRSAIQTDPITGLFEACIGAKAIIYRVPARFGSTYTWSVTNASIISGQGTNEISLNFDVGLGDVDIRVTETMDCGCTWILISECDGDNPPYWWCFKGSGIEYNGSYLLKDAFEYVLDQIGCDGIVGVTSDFFEWNPQGDAPNYVAGQNYVTGLPNQVDFLTIIQKSDAKDPNATNPATVGKSNLKTMISWLFEEFQVYWFREGSYIRFEHISYFQAMQGLDLTLPQYAKEVVKSNRYSHNNDERPKYETFAFAESRNQDFIGDDIYYDTLCVSQDPDNNILEHTVNGITTDIQFVINSPDDISNDGFVMLATYKSGNKYIAIIDVGVLSNQNIVNAPLSWANLHDAFFRHFRYWKDGYLNNSFTIFETFRNTIIQEPLTIKMCCELLSFSPLDEITTPLGQKWLSGMKGIPEKSEYDISKETLTLTIAYPY